MMLSVSAVQLNVPYKDGTNIQNGIPYGTLWEGNHWREQWPRGDTDQGQLDDTVVNFLAPPPPVTFEHQWYEYEPHSVVSETGRGGNQFQGVYHHA